MMSELEITATRQHRVGGGRQRAGGETPLPYHPKAVEAADALAHCVGRWARRLAQAQGLSLMTLSEPRVTVWSGRAVVPVRRWDLRASGPARWILGHRGALGRFTGAPTMLADLERAMGAARVVVDRPPDLVYAGQCGWTVDSRECTYTLYVDPAWSQVTCPSCGNISWTSDRLWMIDQAMDAELTAVEISRAIPTWQGRPVTAAMIRGYASRGRLTAVGTRRVGPTRSSPVYRLGDVRDVLISLLAESDVSPGNGTVVAL